MEDHAFHKVCAVLSNEDVVHVCRALKTNQLVLLCLRECTVRDKDLERILKLVGSCKSLHQLTLNIRMVTNMHHIEILAQCIQMNKSLTGLHVHGSDLGDVGMQILGRALSVHPGIVSLDVGDCKLSDMSIDVLYSLMLPVSNRPGITELTLSDNPRISALGWAQFSMGLANCNTLRWLFLDYNLLGDYGASSVLVAMSASQSVEVLDLEGCGLTEHTGQVILHMVQNHLGSLSGVKLSNNRIRKCTVEAIKKHISENHLDDLDSVSTFTADEMSFSTNKCSSGLKTTRHNRLSSSSSSGSSTSSSDKSSGDDKNLKGNEMTESADGKAIKQMQKQYKEQIKKKSGDTKTEIKKDKKKGNGGKNKDKENNVDDYKTKTKEMDNSANKNIPEDVITNKKVYTNNASIQKKFNKKKINKYEEKKDFEKQKGLKNDNLESSNCDDDDSDSLGEELDEIPVFYK